MDASLKSETLINNPGQKQPKEIFNSTNKKFRRVSDECELFVTFTLIFKFQQNYQTSPTYLPCRAVFFSTNLNTRIKRTQQRTCRFLRNDPCGQ